MAKERVRKPGVKVRCMYCQTERTIMAGEVKPGDHPMCSKCYMPMVPVQAVLR